MRASSLAFVVGLLLATGAPSIANADQEEAGNDAAPKENAEAKGTQVEAGQLQNDGSDDSVEQDRFRAGAGLLVLPDLGPAVELGVRVGGGVWVEVEGWLAVSRLDDDYAPPSTGIGPRLSYRALYPSWELRASLAVPILQHDRQYVSQHGATPDEVRDYLVPSFAPGLAAGYRVGPVTLGIDAELVVAMTEYFDYSIFVQETGMPGLVSRGISLTAFPKVALVVGCFL